MYYGYVYLHSLLSMNVLTSVQNHTDQPPNFLSKLHCLQNNCIWKMMCMCFAFVLMNSMLQIRACMLCPKTLHT